MKLAMLSPKLTRLAAAALVAAGLVLSIGINAAGATGETLSGKPVLLDVHAAPGSTTDAVVTFTDMTWDETGFEIFARVPTTDGSINVSSTMSAGGLPGVGIPTPRVISHLKSGTNYCFSVRAYRLGGDYDWSAKSNEICYTMPTPKPTKPDLAVTRISGPTEIFNGMTAIYEVAIWNEGTPANGTTQIVLNFLGALEPWQMVETPAGFTCSPERGFTCIGSLGGVDDPMITRSAVFKVQGHAKEKGQGTVVASLNHDRALDESDVANNLKTLNVTVK